MPEEIQKVTIIPKDGSEKIEIVGVELYSRWWDAERGNMLALILYSGARLEYSLDSNSVFVQIVKQIR